MEKNCYNLSEVIFGLREEYVKIREELNMLKQHIDLSDSKIKDLNLWLFRNGVIECEITRDESKLKTALSGMYHKISGEPRNISGIIMPNEDNSYMLYGIYDSDTIKHLTFQQGEQVRFDKEFKAIINSEFMKNMEVKEKIKALGLDASLKIGRRQIRLINNTDSGFNQKFYLSYHSDNDTINVTSNENLCEYSLEQIFKTRFPKFQFPEYHRNLIESNAPSTNDIEIVNDENDEYKKHAKLLVDDSNKRLILTKF